MNQKSKAKLLTTLAILVCSVWNHLSACTGIILKAGDGAVVYGRTMEWGSFDLNSRLVIVPRGYKYAGHTPDGKPGKNWQGKYGVAGIDAVGQDVIVDGMNEQGLTVGLFYHPGYADYQKYDPAAASETMSPTDVG